MKQAGRVKLDAFLNLIAQGAAGMIIDWLCRLINAQRRELSALVWSFVYFFLLLCSYYILRSIREEMGITSGVKNLPWLFTATFVVMLVIMPLFGWLTSRFPRRRFLPYVYLFFVANLLLFYLLFAQGYGLAWVARVFFVWLSVFGLFVVSVFWSFMTDIYRNEQAKRLFGFIAAGGTTGAIAGPLISSLTVQKIGIYNLVLLSAIDNLVKGASGQAVQNMNIMFGLAEDAGIAGIAMIP